MVVDLLSGRGGHDASAGHRHFWTGPAADGRAATSSGGASASIGAVTDLATHPRQREALLVAALAALGVVAGVAAEVFDRSVGWGAAQGSFIATSVLAVALLGRWAPHGSAAVLRSVVFYAAMSIAVCVSAAELIDVGWNLRKLAAGLFLSATVVPALALALWWATRRAGVLPGAMVAVPTALVLAGGAVWWQIEVMTGMQPYLVDRPVQAAFEAGTALVLLLALPRHVSTRLWAVVFAVPFTWALWASDLLQQVP
jgi:hypothetical protein